MKGFITGVMLIEYVYRICLSDRSSEGVHRRGSVKGFIENFILMFSLFHFISMFYRKLYIILMQK